LGQYIHHLVPSIAPAVMVQAEGCLRHTFVSMCDSN
jgi:hypothetical protein